MKLLRELLIVLALVAFSGNVSARASDFEVRTLNGEDVALSSYFEPGKWTMVMLWTTYCVTCRKQFPMISRYHNEHKDQDAKVIGISLDGLALMDRVRDYILQQPMAFESGVTEIARFTRAFKAITEEDFMGTPTYLMFDPTGALVGHAAGPMKIELAERFIADNPPE